MSSSPATTLTCTQCGGELHPDEGQIFLTCPFCGATVYVDKSRVVFHWSLAPTLNETQAAGALRRWMSGSQTVKDLDKKASIVSQTFQYFPVWYFKFQSGPGREEEAIEPAAATSVTELRSLKLPAGDLQRYDASLDAQAAPPSVPLDTAAGWVRQQHLAKLGSEHQAGSELRESALVHIPVYFFKYAFQNRTFTAVVEAATGSVIANIFPAKAEAPYLLAGGVTALVYLCLALFPIGGMIFGDEVGATTGLVIALGAGAVAAPFLFAFAAWVASKI